MQPFLKPIASMLFLLAFAYLFIDCRIFHEPAVLGDPQPVREGDGVGVQHHVEAASAQILGLEFAAPIAEERVRMLQSRTLGGKQQKELIIEVIVVWQAEQCATACEIRDPPMRRIIGQAIAEPLVPRIQEQIHGMRTDGARCKFV